MNSILKINKFRKKDTIFKVKIVAFTGKVKLEVGDERDERKNPQAKKAVSGISDSQGVIDLTYVLDQDVSATFTKNALNLVVEGLESSSYLITVSGSKDSKKIISGYPVQGMLQPGEKEIFNIVKNSKDDPQPHLSVTVFYDQVDNQIDLNFEVYKEKISLQNINNYMVKKFQSKDAWSRTFLIEILEKSG